MTLVAVGPHSTAAGGRRAYTPGEEIANSVIHGVGIVLAIAGLAVLATFATLKGGPAHVVGCSIFGTTLVLLYTASTLYHSIPLPKAKAVLQVLDHAAIYLLIAGTYTPFALAMRGIWGWTLLAVVWTLAFVGVVGATTGEGRTRVPRLPLYIGMGWTAVVFAVPLVRSLAPAGVALVVAGGVVYTAGVVFYRWHSLRYHHAVWHGFVLVGSILHYFAVLLYVIPAT